MLSKKSRYWDLILSAILIATTVAISLFLIIPIPMTHGNINLCDAGIFIAALGLGAKKGGLVGALTGLLLDLLSGYAQYMLFSFIAHGLEGIIAGTFAAKSKSWTTRLFGLVLAGFTMMVVYFLADTYMYNLGAGTAGIFPNVLQALVGIIIALIIYPRIKQFFRN